jgi:hypothetical protein
MPAVRVVLYAEGPGETAGVSGPYKKTITLFKQRKKPGDILSEDDLGTGHLLLRRSLEQARSLSPNAICFEEGLRHGGTTPHGSQLLNPRVLRRLLSWFKPEETPDLVVILVDRDGKPKRRALLRSHLNGLMTSPWVIGIAREEFEAWLIADEAAVAKVIGQPVNRTKKPESLRPKEAKRIFNDWIATAVPRDQQVRVRREVASHIDLAVLQKRCPAFGEFLRDLAHIEIQRG